MDTVHKGELERRAQGIPSPTLGRKNSQILKLKNISGLDPSHLRPAQAGATPWSIPGAAPPSEAGTF